MRRPEQWLRGAAGRFVAAGLLLGCLVMAGADRPGPHVRQLVERTVAEVGRTRVVTFAIDEASVEDLTLATQVSDAAILEVVLDAQLTEGAQIGYARVRGLAAGRAELRIGGAPITIDVVEPRAPVPAGAPAVIGPTSGAIVWGPIAVGVEVREDGPELRRIVLRLDDGTTLEPVDDTARRFRPVRQLAFEVDTTARPDGVLEMTPIALDAAGVEQAGGAVRVRVAHPVPDDLIEGEAESRYDVERPQRFRDERRNIGRHDDASNGAFFANASSYPAVCFPVTVERPGWYQMILTAAGTRGQGALPTVGVVIDGRNQSTTNGRLLRESWHRAALGVPFWLDEGTHVVTPYFANDFYVPMRADRNLYIDRFEVARVSEGGWSAAAGGAMVGDDMTMGGGMMMATGEGGTDVDAPWLVEDPHALTAAPLRIGFVRPLHGQILPGLIEIEGRVWWAGVETSRAPMVTLIVNDEPVMMQRSAAPRFWVDPSCFDPGANDIQLRAEFASGPAAATPVQRMIWPAEAVDDERTPARTHWRFSIHEQRWDPAIRELLRAEHHPKERRAAALYSAGEIVLDLPETITGAHQVMLELRGDQFEGAPIAAVSLRAGDKTVEVGETEAPGWWDNNRRVGTVELPKGPKQLVVAFTNDHYERGRGDRNLWLQSVILVEEAMVKDLTPPVAEIRYPPAGHVVHDADAIVAEVSDNASLASVELLLDGMRTGHTVNLNMRPGRVVLPVLTRSVSAGEHQLGILATDVAGNSIRSTPRTIVVSHEAPDSPSTFERAVHLLNRFAYGPDPDELGALLVMGEEAWLEDRLGSGFDAPGDAAALGSFMPFFVNRNNYEVQHRAIAHLITTPNPVRARFVLWTQNHFSTWIRKIEGVRKWEEHVAFSRLGPAPFDRLLLASAESPAMLGYLDQDSSFAGRLNENYAREIMELHTLGVDGGYAQEDVTNLAALLTGWTVSAEGDGHGGGPQAIDYTFRFDPALNDGAANQVVGVRFPEAAPDDRYDRILLLLETLAAHPSTARFVSRKLAEHYVAVPAPDALVDDLAVTFLETGGDMKAMLAAIAAHDTFWAPETAERVASGLDYAVRLCRTTGHQHPWQVGEYLRRSGQGMFDRSSPDGYPEEDLAAPDSNMLLQRWRLTEQARGALSNLVPNGWRYGPGQADAQWSQLVVDCVAVRLTGRVLSEQSNRAALDAVAAASGNRNQRVMLIAPVIAAMPEANLK